MRIVRVKYKVTDSNTGGIRVMTHPKVAWFVKRERYNVRRIELKGALMEWVLNMSNGVMTPYYIIKNK